MVGMVSMGQVVLQRSTSKGAEGPATAAAFMDSLKRLGIPAPEKAGFFFTQWSSEVWVTTVVLPEHIQLNQSRNP